TAVATPTDRRRRQVAEALLRSRSLADGLHVAFACAATAERASNAQLARRPSGREDFRRTLGRLEYVSREVLPHDLRIYLPQPTNELLARHDLGSVSTEAEEPDGMLSSVVDPAIADHDERVRRVRLASPVVELDCAARSISESDRECVAGAARVERGSRRRQRRWEKERAPGRHRDVRLQEALRYEVVAQS